MKINKLFEELNNRRANMGRDPIERDEFIEVISAMGVKGEVLTSNGEIYPVRAVQVELAQTRYKHMVELMKDPELP